MCNSLATRLKGSLRAVAGAGLLASALCSCAATRQVQFNEADFAATAGRGAGVVSGRAYALLDGGRTIAANGEVIVLAPVNAYTTENIQRRFQRGENLRSADQRIDKYLRSAVSDGQGNFVIRGVPSGDYYVEAKVGWTTQHEETDNDGIEEMMNVDHDKLIYARVSIKNGQSARVTSWNQDSPVHDAFYAYGGTLSHPHHQLIGRDD